MERSEMLRDWFLELRRRALDAMPRKKSDIELIDAALKELDYGTKAHKFLTRLRWKLSTNFRMDCVPNNDREVEVTVLNGNVNHRMNARFTEGVWVSAYDMDPAPPMEPKGIDVKAWRELKEAASDAGQ